ncbi:MAG: accessory Sec system glycosylation chaperone GtfB, partial [Agathobacter sp.]|nr:accessory Sec system glycosylation chaperone GtfB [Agathobacter sp.]
MGNLINSEVVLLFDVYNQESQNLHTSFKLAGKDYVAAVIDDDGFLPDDAVSVYGYFLGDF